MVVLKMLKRRLKQMKKMYEYDDRYMPGEMVVPIKIVEGPYKGTVFTYGEVSFNEEDDNVNCKFQYNIVEKPDDLVEDYSFVNQLGEILVDILAEEIEETQEDFLRSGIDLNNEDS